MSEAVRRFDIKEQWKKDLVGAIATAKPIVSLIRNCGKLEKMLSEIVTKIKNLEEDESCFEQASSKASIDETREFLGKEIERVKEKMGELCRRKGNLQEECDEINGDINKYIQYLYAESNKYKDGQQVQLDSDFLTGADDDTVLTTMILLHHDGWSSPVTIDDGFKEIVTERFGDKARDYSTMMEHLKANEI